MSFFLTSLKTPINDETLVVCLSEDWGSKNSQYRQQLRQGLFQELRKNGDMRAPESQILSLEQLPRSEIFSISVSHSHALGGFALSKKAKALGLDIELSGRVKQSVINRMTPRAQPSTADLPSATHQWVAQEASFKAFSRLFPIKVLSKIIVSKWDLRSDEGDLNQARFISDFNGVSANGVIVSHENHLIAICTIFT